MEHARGRKPMRSSIGNASSLSATVAAAAAANTNTSTCSSSAKTSPGALTGIDSHFAHDIPPYFCCPISSEIMLDPCIAPCGHMFDRTSLFPYIQVLYLNPSHPSSFTHIMFLHTRPASAPEINCPLCGEPIVESRILPCHAIKSAIAKYLGDSLHPAEAMKRGPSVPPARRTVISMLLHGWKKRSTANKNTKPPAPRSRRIADHKSSGSNCGSLNASSSNMSHAQVNTTVVNCTTLVNLAADEYLPDCPVVPAWARLVPLIDGVCPMFVVDRDKYIGGRNPNCHAHITLDEISARHFCIWRIRREDGKFEVFLEDASTNGTFVNGNAIGRGNRKLLYHGSEITLGRKFTTRRGLPKIPAFIKWLGQFSPDEFGIEIERLNNLPNFWALLRASEETLEQVGIVSGPLRVIIIAGTNKWEEDHQFPAFVLEILDPDQFVEDQQQPLLPQVPLLLRPQVSTYQLRMAGHERGLLRINNPESSMQNTCGGIQESAVAAASGGLVATGLEDMVSRMSVSNSVVRALRSLFPELDDATIGLVAGYEMVLGARGEALLGRCVLKIAEFQAARATKNGSSSRPQDWQNQNPPASSSYDGVVETTKNAQSGSDVAPNSPKYNSWGKNNSEYTEKVPITAALPPVDEAQPTKDEKGNFKRSRCCVASSSSSLLSLSSPQSTARLVSEDSEPTPESQGGNHQGPALAE